MGDYNSTVTPQPCGWSFVQTASAQPNSNAAVIIAVSCCAAIIVLAAIAISVYFMRTKKTDESITLIQ